jgi:hypothetical protein
MARNFPRRLHFVFISEISTGFDPKQYVFSESYTLFGRGMQKLRSRIVAEEFLDAVNLLRSLGLQITVTVRLHPKETPADLGQIVNEFDHVSADSNPMDLLVTADIVVGMSSMLLAEAHALGIPCLSILPRVEESVWLDETSDGSILVVTKKCDIAPSIKELLAVQSGADRGNANGLLQSISLMHDALRIVQLSDASVF